MRLFTICRALLVRVLFAVHGLIAIWRMYMVKGEMWCWYLTAALGLLLVETLVTLCVKKGKEWKWFCPSVFLYLLSVVPAIWFLELHEMEERISLRENQFNNRTTNVTNNRTEPNLHFEIDGINIPLSLSPDLWLRLIQQFLLLMLIIGRWLLPKGSLTHDQLSQLLLVYVGTAADIVEFYEAFSEDQVKYNRVLAYTVLGTWTTSLIQFSLVLTATRARSDQSGVSSPTTSNDDDRVSCCNPEIYGIVISIMLQDLPFLVVRMVLIFRYKVVSYTNFFFTSKNSLVIILLLYRLVVIQTAAAKAAAKNRQTARVRDVKDAPEVVVQTTKTPFKKTADGVCKRVNTLNTLN